MSGDLHITDADIAASASRLRTAADPVVDSVCFSSAVTGSADVAAALDGADSLMRRLMGALAAVVLDTATDAEAIGTTLGDADSQLAAGAS